MRSKLTAPLWFLPFVIGSFLLSLSLVFLVIYGTIRYGFKSVEEELNEIVKLLS